MGPPSSRAAKARVAASWPAPAQAAIHSSSASRCAQKSHAIPCAVRPAAHQRLQFARKGGDDGGARHDCGLTRWAVRGPRRAHIRWPGTTRWRRAWRGRRAKSGIPVPAAPGRWRQTSSCGPCALLQAWRAARLPRIRPVIHLFKKRVGRRDRRTGSSSVGEGIPVIADILSRICFSVRFSPPRM